MAPHFLSGMAYTEAEPTRLSLEIWAGLTPKETCHLVAAKTGTPVKDQPEGTALNKGEEESPWIQLYLKPDPPLPQVLFSDSCQFFLSSLRQL